MSYRPDYWKIVKIYPKDSEEPFYKVFASWVGGFANGDQWRLNSGITKVKEEENRAFFKSSSPIKIRSLSCDVDTIKNEY